MSTLAGFALLGAALGVTRRRPLTEEERMTRRLEIEQQLELDRKERRKEDRDRSAPGGRRKERESRAVEIRRISAERGVTTEEIDPSRIRPQYRSKAELRMPIEVAARADVQKYVAELRKAINKKRLGYARTMLRKLERAVGKLNADKDGPMIDQAERLLKVARSRGIR